uniref:Uncharacterized protein n=1 Tax=Eucampia antarctica TaxID=49252 RepID=A0A7S2W1S3_9STRA|mmetsp:Transcript_17107/g.16545  ORF Transcript_17107/g.16545 Transcript_17107/m.16545 type:complete len:311 (+) Transcript_17107:64-996(+)
MLTQQIIDPVCVICAVLFIITNSMGIAIRFKYQDRRHFNYASMTELDPNYIKDEWDFRYDGQTLETVTGLLGAVAWFSLCIPILETSWMLSKGGTKRTGSHAFLCIFTIGSSLVELIAKLMFVGMNNTAEWISSKFTLNDWDGWKTLEVAFIVVRGAMVWVDAFEYFALFLIMTLIGLSVLAENRAEGTSITFDNKWAIFGFVIGISSLIEFSADVLRFVNWGWFSRAALIVSVFNSIIALPIWLLLLGLQLPHVRHAFENSSSVVESESSSSAKTDDKEGGEQPPSGAFQSPETNFQTDAAVTAVGELS